MTGLNVILGFQSGHLIQDEWAQLQKRIERKGKNCTDSLIISAGAPNRAGQCFLSEELLADALLRHPEPVATTNLSSVILHFWSAGRAVELRGEQPVELWPAVCSGFSRRPCHFEHSRSVARTERNTPRRVAGLGEGARHLLDLPRGYHTAHRAQAWERRRRSAASLRPVCGAVGRCQDAPISLSSLSGWLSSSGGDGPERCGRVNPRCAAPAGFRVDPATPLSLLARTTRTRGV
jgi:hypothetical protein